MSLKQLLLPLIRLNPTSYSLSAAFWTAFLMLQLIPPLIVRNIFDGLTNSAVSGINVSTLLALFVAVSIGRLVLTSAAVFGDITYKYTAGAALRKNMFGSLMKQPINAVTAVSSGEAVSRFRDDVDQMVEFALAAPFVLGQMVFMVLAVIVMVHISVLMTVVVVAPVLGVVVIVQQFSRLIERYRHNMRLTSGRVDELLGEIFNGWLSIVIGNAQAGVVNRLMETNQHRRKAMRRDQSLSTLMSAMSLNTSNLGTGIMLLIGAHLMQTRAFTVGDFALFINYLYYVTGLPVWLGQFLTTRRQTAVAQTRLVSLTGTPSVGVIATHARSRKPQGGIQVMQGPLETFEVRDLRFEYAVECGIRNVSFSLPRGSITVITGRVGAGKTTLLRCALGLLPLQSGTIWWNGHRVVDPRAFLASPRCGYVPQVPQLFDDTIRQNILLGYSTNELELQQAVRLAVLEEDIAMMAGGLDASVGSKASRLSGGQIQRVAVARALVRAPELLVMDDVSSALDAATEQMIWDRITGPRRGTCLIVSHRLGIMERADHIIVLSEGKIHAQGTLAFLLKHDSEMQQIWATHER
ncbi:ABC transporter ATP-binding protein [Alicyclobacillus fodiniaquatilis]|uniref:ABC transporter ATP-binding protein n=1 Tax=Alicyclobacillus fodiniaquatilis TaxID=1661150 RepID=A0ABW4JLF0_9BACL